MSFYRGTGTPGTGTPATRPVRLDELAASSGSSLVGFIQSVTGAVASDVQAKLRESVSVKDFGAVGDGVTDDTAAFTAAFAAGKKSVYVPEGVYIVSTIALPTMTRLFGAGKRASIIKSNGSSNHVITLTYTFHSQIDNLQISGNNTKTNLCGIYANGTVWTTLSELLVQNNGSHGIKFTDTGTAYIGNYPIQIDRVHSVANTGDGLNAVAETSVMQINGLHIDQSEFQSNGGNGITTWGSSINVVKSLSEGNTGYGVYLDNGRSSGAAYSAASISIKESYFELNTAGHIGARVGTYGVISGLEIIGNYLSTNAAILGAGYIPVRVTNYSSSLNAIRGLKFENNYDEVFSGTITTYANFGNALNASSVVSPYFGSLTSVDITTIPGRYLNLGYGTFRYVKNLTLNGWYFGKNGSGITYSGFAGSDNITVSGSNVSFPIQVPSGSFLYYVAVPVATDFAAYNVQFTLRAKAYNATNVGVNPSSIGSTTVAGAGTQMITSPTFASFLSGTNYLVGSANLEIIMQITVTWTTPGTSFLLGSPTVYYVEP